MTKFDMKRIINPEDCAFCGKEILSVSFTHEGKNCCVICLQEKCPEMFTKESETS